MKITVKTVFAVILSVLTSFATTTFFPPRTAEGADGAALTAALISDTHVKDGIRKLALVPGLRDISRCVKPDLFISAGDNTDNGNEENWSAFKDALDKHLTVKNRIVALGNHDTWTSYDTPHDYGEAKQNYLRFANDLMGTAFDEVWFTYEINGYTFIVTGSEGTSVGAEISDRQLEWLDAALAAAAAPGKPLFVICHQPLNYTHGIGDNEGGNGFEDQETSEKMQAILDRYENVFLISGHTHFGLNGGRLGYPEDFATVEKVGAHITSVNLPCYEYGSFGLGGSAWIGQGVVMRVYPDRVEFLGRNFAMSQWVWTVNVSVPLTGAQA